MNRPDPEAHRKALLEKYDANKDGKLDDTELTALGKDVYEGKLPPPGRGPRGPGEHGGPGFGPQQQGGPDGPEFRPPGRSGPPRDGDRGFGPRGPHQSDGPRAPQRPVERGRFGRGGSPERMPPGPERRGFGGPNSEEGRVMLENNRREFLKKYDANSDGKLDSAEREAIGRDIEDGKLPPPPPPPPTRREMPKNEQ